MFDTMAGFAVAADAVTSDEGDVPDGWIRMPKANRVASMFRWMYGVSFCSSWGPTRSFWTIAGTIAPATMDVSANSPMPTIGSAHPRTLMFTRNNSAHAIAMNTSRRSAGSSAWLSVYEATVTTPRGET